MIRPPGEMGTFEFVAIATLRVAQLTRGCTPRISEKHSTAITAQMEVAEGRVTSAARVAPEQNPL